MAVGSPSRDIPRTTFFLQWDFWALVSIDLPGLVEQLALQSVKDPYTVLVYNCRTQAVGVTDCRINDTDASLYILQYVLRPRMHTFCRIRVLDCIKNGEPYRVE